MKANTCTNSPAAGREVRQRLRKLYRRRSAVIALLRSLRDYQRSAAQ